MKAKKMTATFLLVDFEFRPLLGDPPVPVCVVAKNLRTGETRRVFLTGGANSRFPFPLGPDVVYVAYMASAELNCHLALGWEMPHHVLDLHAEFRQITSGILTPAGKSLLGALDYFGKHGISAAEKHDMRQLVIRGAPYTAQEQEDILKYCEDDVTALEALLEAMLPRINLPQALLRGRYMKAASSVEMTGVPIDLPNLQKIRDSWVGIKRKLVEDVDRDHGVYDGLSFREHRFEALIARLGIRWPRHGSGRLDLRRETFRRMVDAHPQFRNLYELRKTLSGLRLEKLAVGLDGRNRTGVRAFASKTGRNQPKSSEFVFGQPRWVRHLIRPERGMALAYVDFKQQEFGIAGALSGDKNMMGAYRADDPYLHFAKIAGAVPESATKASHPKEREQYKVAALGVLMGIGAENLGMQAGGDELRGELLLRKHREVFPRFCEWSDDQVNRALLGERLSTVYGWGLGHSEVNRLNTYRNFKLQGNGAEMLRLSAIAITERGIRLCAMIHDAVLIEAPEGEIDAQVQKVKELMADASAAVLDGFRLDTDSTTIRHPQRFSDQGGASMWQLIAKLADLSEP